MSNTVSVTITQQSNYQFLVDFGTGIPAVQADEPAPLGAGEGPSPSQLLLAAVTNCLSASLFFALQKFKQDGVANQATRRRSKSTRSNLSKQKKHLKALKETQ